MVIFGEDSSDLRKCQVLTVQREAYRCLATVRARVNPIFSQVPLDEDATNALPLDGVPQQFLECAVQMPEVDLYKATRAGPGTIRDPLDVADPPDDVSDESSCDHDHDDIGDEANPSTEAPSASAAQPSTDTQDVEQLNHFETPIGIDPTAVPTFVQHVAAFKQNLAHVRDSVASCRVLHQESRSADARNAPEAAASSTARAAADNDIAREHVADQRVRRPAAASGGARNQRRA